MEEKYWRHEVPPSAHRFGKHAEREQSEFLARIARIGGQSTGVVESTSPQNTPAYWQSLGQFVQQFSEVEREANFLLWQLTDSDMAVAAAIYRERMPISEVIKALEQLYPLRFTAEEAVASFQDNLRQLKRITKLRNDLLHNGTTFTEQGAAVVKKLAARRNRTEAEVAFSISAKELDQLSSDCGWLATFFWLQWESYEHGAEMAVALAGRTWEYT